MIYFNKKNTKNLIKASDSLEKSNLFRINWLLDNDKICGCIKKGFIPKAYYLQKVKNTFRLIIPNREIISIYLIEDINGFINYINCNELPLISEDDVKEGLSFIEEYPCNGFVHILDDKLYLYDIKG